MGKLIKVDVSGIKEAIKEMDIYKETKKIIERYEEEKARIEARKKDFEEHMQTLQKALTDNMLACETYKDDRQMYINLKFEQKTINQELEMVNLLIEEMNEEYTELKLKFVPLLQQAGRTENRSNYVVTEDLMELKYIVLTAIAELGNEMRTQFREVEDVLTEVYNDDTVQEKLQPRKIYSDSHSKPEFSLFESYLINKNEVFGATSGYVQMTKPKSLVESEKAEQKEQQEVKEDEGK